MAANLGDAARAFLLDQIGVVQNIVGQYAEAEATYRQSLALRESGGNLVDPAIAWTLNGLASTLINQSRWRDADPSTRRALEIADAGPAPDEMTQFVALMIVS